jgi:hypothetical protein
MNKRNYGLRLAGLLACLATLAACTTAGSPSASQSSVATTPNLRGTSLTEFACSQLRHGPQRPVESLAVGAISGDAQRLTVCGGTGQAVQEFGPDTADFTALIDALSLPDIAGTAPKSCPQSFAPQVIVQTTQGAWLAHEPVDQTSCTLVRAEVLKALDVATSNVGYLPDEPGTQITVPTSNWTHGPLQGNFFGPLKAIGSCVVLGSRPPYSLVVWPRGWSALRWSSGDITVYNADNKPFATTGRNVGLLGNFSAQRPTTGQSCLKRFPADAFYVTVASS